MNLPTQNTDGLRDIHLPDAISWWPPAIGWWLLLAIVILAFIFIPKLYRRLTYTPLNKVAKLNFKNIIEDYNENKNDLSFVVATSQFLRQTAMSYYGREKAAQQTGEQWLQTLNEMNEENYFNNEIKQSLINAAYQKNIAVDVEKIITAVQSWLAKLPNHAKGLNK